MMEDYRWRRVPSYRLSQTVLEDFLVRLFGTMNFYIRVSRFPDPCKGTAAESRRHSLRMMIGNSGFLVILQRYV